MTVYIKDEKTFETKFLGEALSWDMTEQSIYDEVTKIGIRAEKEGIEPGDYIYMDGYFGVIKSIDVDDEVLTITANDGNLIFYHDLFETEDNCAAGIEQFLKRQVEANFKNVDDAEYAMPYLNVVAATTTPAPDLFPEVEGGVWNIKTFLSKTRRLYRVFMRLVPERNVLNVIFEKRAGTSRKVDLSMENYELTEESYSSQQTAKVTSKCKATGEEADWYLLEDGSITQQKPAEGRAKGEWAKIVVDEEEQVESAVKEEFSNNSYSHMIEFRTREEMDFFDPVQLRTPGGTVLQSYISAVRKMMGDDRTTYKTGSLQISLTEQLNKRFTRG